MKQDDVKYALAAIYTALTESATLATGRPVGPLCDHIIREMSDDAPAQARELLRCLAGSN